MKPVVFSGLKEICFVVPDAEGAVLHLGRLPVLARRKPVLEQLIRYDTAEQHLRQQHIGLLLCRTPEQCQQILKVDRTRLVSGNVRSPNYRCQPCKSPPGRSWTPAGRFSLLSCLLRSEPAGRCISAAARWM